MPNTCTYMYVCLLYAYIFSYGWHICKLQTTVHRNKILIWKFRNFISAAYNKIRNVTKETAVIKCIYILLHTNIYETHTHTECMHIYICWYLCDMCAQTYVNGVKSMAKKLLIHSCCRLCHCKRSRGQHTHIMYTPSMHMFVCMYVWNSFSASN